MPEGTQPTPHDRPVGLLDDHAAGLLADRDGRWQADDLCNRLVDAVHAIRPDQDEAEEDGVEESVWCSERFFGGGDIHVTANTEHFQLVTTTLTQVMRDRATLDTTKLASAADRADADEVWVANSKVIAKARARALFAMCADTLDGRGGDASGVDGLDSVGHRGGGCEPMHRDPAVSAPAAAIDRPAATAADRPADATATATLDGAEPRRDTVADMARDAASSAAGQPASSNRPSTAGGVAVRPAMQVVITADALAGLSDEPARMLLGGQRITASRLRGLAARNGADVEAVVTGRDGAVVGVGRRSRHAPAKLARLLAALQPTCVAPGCRTRVADVDHAVDWQHDGRTDLDNLVRLCRAHHTAKHAGEFTVEPDAAGRATIRHRSGWTAVHRPPTTGPPPPSRASADRARQSKVPRPPRLRRTGPPRGPCDGDDLPF